MKTQDYLDATKAKIGIQSDYALAKSLDISREYMSQLRSGKRPVSDEVALRIAKLLEVNPIQIIATANAERAKNPEIQAAWTTLMDKISKGFDSLTSRANPRRSLRPAW